MKRHWRGLIVVASLLAASTGWRVGAEGSLTQRRPKNVEAVITQLEHDWANAIVRNQFAELERLLAEEFNGTSPTAHTFPKSVAISELKSGKYAVASLVLDEVSVNVYGDVAVAFTSQKEKSTYAGKDTSGHYHFTDVWAWRGGQWQVVASHGSRYNEDH